MTPALYYGPGIVSTSSPVFESPGPITLTHWPYILGASVCFADLLTKALFADHNGLHPQTVHNWRFSHSSDAPSLISSADRQHCKQPNVASFHSRQASVQTIAPFGITSLNASETRSGEVEASRRISVVRASTEDSSNADLDWELPWMIFHSCTLSTTVRCENAKLEITDDLVERRIFKRSPEYFKDLGISLIPRVSVHYIVSGSLLNAMANSEQEKNFTQEPHPHVLENRRQNAVGHILDEGRRAALQRIDNAKFSWVLIQHFYATQSDLFPCSWFHVKVAFVAGVGFFTDA